MGEIGGLSDGARRLNRLAATAILTGDQLDHADLLEACRPIIYNAIRTNYHNAVTDHEDLAQVGLIAIGEALNAWQPSRSNFGHFASRVIRRRLIDATRTHARRGPSQSLDAMLDCDTDFHPAQDREDSPSRIAENRDTLNHALARCTNLERDAITQFAEGASYSEIAAALGVTEKAIDNAIQRSRQKAHAIAGLCGV